MSWSRYRAEWFGNVRSDVLAGLLIALALIPEAIAFSIVADVDPKVGLYASFSIAVVIAFAGGRPGMISASTAAVALLVTNLVHDHGVQYLLAASVLAGVFQIVAGVLRIGKLMRFISTPVMTGFVNSLAILVFLAQMPELHGVNWQTYPLVAAGLAIIFILPRFFTAVPSPIISVLVLTVVSVAMGLNVHEVHDKGALPEALPWFGLPDVPFTFETFKIIAPYSLSMMFAGLLESLMTARLLDEITDTPSSKNHEAAGQGIANVVTGFLGGMAGCAVVGESLMNHRFGGRGRLSTFCAGGFLIALVVALGDWVGRIPMPALVAVLIAISIGAFDWSSLRAIRIQPVTATAVMIATIIGTVATKNLAIGVAVGVTMNGLFFVWELAHSVHVSSELEGDQRRVYTVDGPIFFVSAERFVNAFDFHERLTHVTIDIRHAHFWDTSAIAALDRVVLKLRSGGARVDISGMSPRSASMIERLATHDKADAVGQLASH
jgi:SulP family sulfate permease